MKLKQFKKRQEYTLIIQVLDSIKTPRGPFAKTGSFIIFLNYKKNDVDLSKSS